MATVENDLASAFVVRELTGAKRILTLKTRALPYRPLELSGTMRNSVEWYPGSPVGTLQVYGAKEEPTTINGQWKDVFLGVQGVGEGTTPASVSVAVGGDTDVQGVTDLTTARALVKVVDDMRRRGSEVEVTWLDQARRGIIEKLTVKWHTGHDCEWELMFTWTSQSESLSEVPLHNDASDLGDLPAKVQAAVDDLAVDAASIVPQAGDRFASALVQYAGILLNIQDIADEAASAVSQVAGDLQTPQEALRRTAGLLDGLKLEADSLALFVAGTLDGLALDSGNLSSFGEVLARRADAHDRAARATALRDLAAREQLRLLRSAESDVVRVFQARDGQDLREVSQRFYGTPDSWRQLAAYNHLSSSGLIAGQVVFVPARPPTGAEC